MIKGVKIFDLLPSRAPRPRPSPCPLPKYDHAGITRYVAFLNGEMGGENLYVPYLCRVCRGWHAGFDIEINNRWMIEHFAEVEPLTKLVQ